MADEPTDTRRPSRSGMMPLDGAPWPPRPTEGPPPEPEPELWGTVGARPEGSDVADWRTMEQPVPDGYRGSASAPPAPAPRWNPWCIAAPVLAAAAWAAWLFSEVLAMPLGALGVAAGLLGVRATSVNPTLKGKWMGAVAVPPAAIAGALAVVRLFG